MRASFDALLVVAGEAAPPLARVLLAVCRKLDRAVHVGPSPLLPPLEATPPTVVSTAGAYHGTLRARGHDSDGEDGGGYSDQARQEDAPSSIATETPPGHVHPTHAMEAVLLEREVGEQRMELAQRTGRNQDLAAAAADEEAEAERISNLAFNARKRADELEKHIDVSKGRLGAEEWGMCRRNSRVRCITPSPCRRCNAPWQT